MKMNLKSCISVFAMALLQGCSSGVPISIANQSGQALRNVTISGSGFRQHVSLIPSGETTTLHVDPKGETGVAIAFNLGEKRFSYAEDGYFESDGYQVAITVDAVGRASVRSELPSLFTRLVGRR
jgi:hypothetical protein